MSEDANIGFLSPQVALARSAEWVALKWVYWHRAGYVKLMTRDFRLWRKMFKVMYYCKYVTETNSLCLISNVFRTVCRVCCKNGNVEFLRNFGVGLPNRMASDVRRQQVWYWLPWVHQSYNQHNARVWKTFSPYIIIWCMYNLLLHVISPRYIKQLH